MSFDKHPIKDLPLKILDGDRGKKYPKQNDFYNEGFCLFLNTGNVTSNGFVFTNCSFISQERHNLLRKGTLQRGDIVLTTRGTVGNCAFYGSKIPFEVVRINSGMIILRAEEGLEAKYLYYFLRSNIFSKQVEALRTGSAQPQLPIRDIREIVIPKPPIEDQKAIAHILETLDKKIELNKKTNETLEGITKAIFKSWFIDFDPVKAKSEGRSTGLPDEISDLFPDSFENSELGQIPKRWQISTSTDFCDSVRDGTHDSPKQISFGGYPLVTSKHIKNKLLDLSSAYNISDEDYHAVNKRSLVEKGDVLISMIGTLGEILYIDHNPKFAIKNIGLFKSKSEELGQCWFLYLQSKIAKNFLRINAQGSTQQYLSLATLRSIPVIFPGIILLERFADYTREIFYQKLQTNNEIQLLEQIRNTLLPKLISGEIRVPDAEQMIEAISL